MNRMLRGFIALALLLGGFAAYGYGAAHSPLLDRDLAERRAWLRLEAAEGGADAAAEAGLAEAYWQRNPDVAADRYFGRGGVLGFFGPREHWKRHGRREGRAWGP
jgi:hypothetical protein